MAGAGHHRRRGRERGSLAKAASARIHVMEAGWLQRMQGCRLYAYRLPAEMFRPHEVGGYWVTEEHLDQVI